MMWHTSTLTYTDRVYIKETVRVAGTAPLSVGTLQHCASVVRLQKVAFQSTLGPGVFNAPVIRSSFPDVLVDNVLVLAPSPAWGPGWYCGGAASSGGSVKLVWPHADCAVACVRQCRATIQVSQAWLGLDQPRMTVKMTSHKSYSVHIVQTWGDHSHLVVKQDRVRF